MRTAAVICSHNGGRFIEAQLDSIAAQTCPIDELRVYDWGSSDDTVARLERWIASSPLHRLKVKLQIMDHAPGPARSFLHALTDTARDSAAELIFIADQDDVWLSEKVGYFLRAYTSSRGFDLAFSDAQILRRDGAITPTFYGKDSPYRRPLVNADRGALLTNPVVGMTMCLRREWLLHLQPAFALDWVMHDWALHMLCWLTGSRRHYIDVPLVMYRQHDQNILGAAHERSVRARLKTVRAHVQRLRRQLKQVRAVAEMLGIDAAPARELAFIQSRAGQVMAAASTRMLTVRYRLFLCGALLTL